MSTTQSPSATLKGGIEASGFHAAELDKRASRADRRPSFRRSGRAARKGAGGWIARNPLSAMGVAIGAGIIIGLLV